MPKPVTDVAVLQEYLLGVLGRASHHAGNVSEIALAVAGAIIWRKDPNPIEVFEREGQMKNVLWVFISGQRYAFTYDHPTQAILIMRGTTQGPVLHSLTNATPLSQLYAIFKSL
jgi:hypothetical protein